MYIGEKKNYEFNKHLFQSVLVEVEVVAIHTVHELNQFPYQH